MYIFSLVSRIHSMVTNSTVVVVYLDKLNSVYRKETDVDVKERILLVRPKKGFVNTASDEEKNDFKKRVLDICSKVTTATTTTEEEEYEGFP